MKCEWCGKRKPVCVGKPIVGPESRMCDPCKERLCRKDADGKFIAMPIEKYMELEKH